jgi:MYXO-CTERM domain-containing protein
VGGASGSGGQGTGGVVATGGVSGTGSGGLQGSGGNLDSGSGGTPGSGGSTESGEPSGCNCAVGRPGSAAGALLAMALCAVLAPATRRRRRR